jgi:hypothetical protein
MISQGAMAFGGVIWSSAAAVAGPIQALLGATVLFLVSLLLAGRGLAQIEPRREFLKSFRAITFGRLSRETDRIKQVRLAIASFAEACSVQKYPDAVPKPLQGQPRLYVYGIGQAEESQLREYAAGRAGRVLPFMPLPYGDRDSIFHKLRQTDVAMMVSWHEGFGLVRLPGARGQPDSAPFR